MKPATFMTDFRFRGIQRAIIRITCKAFFVPSEMVFSGTLWSLCASTHRNKLGHCARRSILIQLDNNIAIGCLKCNAGQIIRPILAGATSCSALHRTIYCLVVASRFYLRYPKGLRSAGIPAGFWIIRIDWHKMTTWRRRLVSSTVELHSSALRAPKLLFRFEMPLCNDQCADAPLISASNHSKGLWICRLFQQDSFSEPGEFGRRSDQLHSEFLRRLIQLSKFFRRNLTLAFGEDTISLVKKFIPFN